MKVEILKPYGFCMGVSNVIKLIEKIMKKHSGEKIYCVGQIVHNKDVNEHLSNKGITILSGDKSKLIDEIDTGVVVFSAHGTDDKIIHKAKNKGLTVYDAVCPFVKKELDIVKESILKGCSIIYIGVRNHDETNAVLSISDKIHFVSNVDDVKKLEIDNSQIVVINQTTLSIYDLKDIYDEIKERYPSALFVDEICNSTRMRQQRIKSFHDGVDGIIVVGDNNSNNTLSLKKVASQAGYDVLLIENEHKLDMEWISTKKSILIASGASTPNEVVNKVYEKIKNL